MSSCAVAEVSWSYILSYGLSQEKLQVDILYKFAHFLLYAQTELLNLCWLQQWH